ncbi:DUF4307 domain-containing protein [Sesbania bispinosa]|nr:DUF4307 domain-containing protein [Sesbania bispinosa]
MINKNHQITIENEKKDVPGRSTNETKRGESGREIKRGKMKAKPGRKKEYHRINNRHQGCVQESYRGDLKHQKSIE